MKGNDTIGRTRIMPSEVLSFLLCYLAAKLSEALTDTPVVCLLGARRCGKSMLSHRCDPDRI